MTEHHTPPTAPLVYLAEPMDRSAGPSRSGHLLTARLNELGLTTYRPATTWGGGQHNPRLVEQFNRDALYAADAVIADTTTGIPSVGVWMEVEAATSRGIPVVVLYAPGDLRSVSLQANPHVRWTDNIKDCAGLAARLAQQHRSGAAAGFDLDRRQQTLRVTLMEGAEPPTKAYPDDAGIDLVCAETVVVPPGKLVDIETTITGVQTPPDTWLMVTSRSSTPRKKGLHVPMSVIDPGWRGPLLVGAWNLTDKPVVVHVRDRIGQMVAVHNRTGELHVQVADRLDPHERGTNGFGSSGGHTENPHPLGAWIGTAA